MCVRMQLVILDHNHNIERKQATTLDEQARYKLVFPKGSKRWVAKPIKEEQDYPYLDYMLEQMVNPEYNVDELAELDVPDLPPNIVSTPRPPLQDTVHEQMSGFGSK